MDTIHDTLIAALKKVLEKKEQSDSPARVQDMLAVSHHLKGHPAHSESLQYKIQYLSVLEYFVNNYADSSLFAVAALHNYKQAFLGKDFSAYTYVCKDINNDTRKVARTRFKTFRLFSNRFVLVMDIAFICAYDDPHKGHTVFRQIKEIYHSRYHSTLDNLYDFLYQCTDMTSNLRSVTTQLQCWSENRKHLSKPLSSTLFVANMNAGKSTLINALVGKNVNKSLSQACTSKLHYIFNKPFEDGFNYEYDYLLDLNADHNTLMEDNPDNSSTDVMVGTYFNLLCPGDKRLCFLDTPGANFSRDASHGEISHCAIDSARYDTLVYIFAAGTTGIHDETEYLNYVKEHCKKNSRLIFVFNKLDEYKTFEDSIEHSMEQVNDDLKAIGFTNYSLYPISAIAGQHAKDVIQGKTFNPAEPEYFTYLGLKARFNEHGYDFSPYFCVPDEYVAKVKKSLSNFPEEFNLLLKSGMLGLEYVLTH